MVAVWLAIALERFSHECIPARNTRQGYGADYYPSTEYLLVVRIVLVVTVPSPLVPSTASTLINTVGAPTHAHDPRGSSSYRTRRMYYSLMWLGAGTHPCSRPSPWACPVGVGATKQSASRRGSHQSQPPASLCSCVTRLRCLAWRRNRGWGGCGDKVGPCEECPDSLFRGTYLLVPNSWVRGVWKTEASATGPSFLSPLPPILELLISSPHTSFGTASITRVALDCTPPFAAQLHTSWFSILHFPLLGSSPRGRQDCSAHLSSHSALSAEHVPISPAQQAAEKKAPPSHFHRTPRASHQRLRRFKGAFRPWPRWPPTTIRLP